MKAIMIGTSGGISLAESNVNRAGPAVLIEVGDDLIIFDVGRSALQNVLKSGYSPVNIEQIFLTHLHSDHIVGLPDFILSPWITSGHSQWEVYGPEGTRTLFDRLFGVDGAFEADILARANSKSSRELIEPRIGKELNRPSFNIIEVSQPGIIYEGESWEVLASFAPKHIQPWLISIAFRVNSEDGSVVITGDTGPHADIIEFAKGCDLLIHDCSIKERTGHYATRLVHTDPISLGKVASEASAKVVVATHISRREDYPEVLSTYRGFVEENFAGQFVLGEDLQVIDIPAGTIR